MANRLEIVQEAGLDFTADLRDIVGYIHRKGNRHIFFAGIVTRCVEGLAVPLDLFKKLSAGVDGRGDKHWIALFSSEERRLRTVGCDAQRRVRFLEGLGNDRGLWHEKMFAAKLHCLLHPRASENRQCLLKTLATLLARDIE